MRSMRTIFSLPILSLTLAAGGIVALPQAAQAREAKRELSEDEARWYRAQLGLATVSGVLEPATDPVGEAVLTWRRLQQPGVRSFTEISSFLLANPGWPNEATLRRNAEAALSLDSFAPDQTLRFFERFPPLTAAGRLRHAAALLGAGKKSEAGTAFRQAWTSGRLTAEEEMRGMALMPGVLTADDHEARADRLLWLGDTAGAARVLPMITSARQPVFAARIAMRSNAVDAAMKMQYADAQAQNDAGYLADKARWLRATGQIARAQALLAGPRALSAPPADSERWYEVLLAEARAASRAGQHQAAYAIASQIDDGVPKSLVIRTAEAGIRDDYTSLAWLAGTTALRQLNRPDDAAAMFNRYALAARSPQTIAKGFYWAGRAAKAGGKTRDAERYFEEAARYFEHFYGQLALEQLGRAQPPAQTMPRIEVSQAQQRSFDESTLVRAARALGQLGAHRDQSLFLRAISAGSSSDADYYLATRLAEELERPDLSVMAGRAWRTSGKLPAYTPTAYPIMKLPEGLDGSWTMIHAITRQESQFDQRAVSSARAQGLMQLMPATARDVSAKLGLPYDFSALTSDKNYNIMLGASYFQRRLAGYGGSYPLAVAAYNGGAGNVNKWLASLGDPRTGQIDIVDWIEAIPFEETRGYVQRVLENAVVYESLNPSNDGKPQRNILSRYLGKSTPG